MRRLAALAVAMAVLGVAWFALRPMRFLRAPAAAPARAATAPVAERVVGHPDTTLEARLQALADAAPGRCAIVAKRLGDGAFARVNAEAALPLLSVVKLPVALVVLDAVDHGRWSLSSPCTLLAGDMHPRGWIGDRYPRGGGPVPLELLLREMLTRSDNSAADALMRMAGGPRAVTAWLEQHGIHDLRVDRNERELGNDWYGLPPGADTMGSAEEIRERRTLIRDAVHDSAALAMLRDPRDTGSADACVNLLERLWRGALLSPAMTDTLESILAHCKTGPHRLPAMLPRGTPVAHKTGTGGTWRGVTIAIDDVGCIRLPNGDVVAIAVLVGEPRGPVPRAERLIARAAQIVYDAWAAGDSTHEASEHAVRSRGK